MKTVIIIQFLYVLINFDGNDKKAYGDGACESSIETRAVLLSCPEKDTGCEEDDPLTKATYADELRLTDMKVSEMKRVKEEIEREFPKRVTECKRKLVITMKLNNKGKIDCDDGFIVIDHVYDPITRGKARLLSPVIVKLRQEQMVQLYPLQFQKIVNSNPSESVFSKETCSKYKGCSVDLDHPTCGITTYNGQPIPFSEGFCCSRDPYVNAMREVLPDKHENALTYKNPGLFSHVGNRRARSAKERSMLINPHLLKGKIGDGKKRRRASEDDPNYSADPNSAKPPIYFFEHDRQVVCSPDNLLKELCSLPSAEDSQEKKEECSQEKGRTEEECSRDDKQEPEDLNTEESQPNSTDDNREQNDGDNPCGNQTDDAGPTNPPKENVPNAFNRIDGIAKMDDNIFNGINRYLNVFRPNGESRYRFAGDRKLTESRLLRGDRNGMNGVEMASHSGNGRNKRDARIGEEVSRHRRKRLIRNNEIYAIPSYQYASKASVKRKKRILNLSDRKMVVRQGEKCEPPGEPCGDVIGPPQVEMNCTLPIFFFAHDKNIICPPNPCPTKNKTCHLENGENSEYEDSNSNLGTETLDEIMHVQPQHSAPIPKITRLHTHKGGTWDVNTNVREGNIFRLDLSKTEKEPKLEHAEKIEQINYEQKRLYPEDIEERVNIHAKLRQGNPKYKMGNSEQERYRYENDAGKQFKGDDRNYWRKEPGNPKYAAEVINLLDLANRKESERDYKPKGVRVHSGNDEAASAEGKRNGMDLTATSGKRKYHRMNGDLRANQWDSIRGHPANLNGGEQGVQDLQNPLLQEKLQNLMKAAEKDDSRNEEEFDEYGERLKQNRMKASRTNADKGDENQRYLSFDLSPDSNRDGGRKKYHQQYNYGHGWDAGNAVQLKDLRYSGGAKDEPVNRENVVDLLAYNHVPAEDDHSKYLVSSQNIFFADSKSRRNMKLKDGRPYEDDRFYDDGKDDMEQLSADQDQQGNLPDSSLNGRKNSREPEDDIAKPDAYAGSYKDEMKMSEFKPQQYFDDFPPLGKEANEEEFNFDGLRNRRRAGLNSEPAKKFFASDFDLLPFSDLHRLRNAQFVRKREKRSVDDGSVSLSSKWQHKTAAGASRRGDEPISSKSKIERSHLRSSGFGDKQCYGDIQKNYARLKPHTPDRGKEREKANADLRMKIDKERLLQSYSMSPGKYSKVKSDAKRMHSVGDKRHKRGQECALSSSSTTTTTTTTTTTPETTTSTTSDTLTFDESSHCMQYSDLWYSVYIIKKPDLSQLVGVQVYDKQTMCDGGTSWRDLTKGYMIRLGTFLQRAEDDVPTISMSFTPTGPTTPKGECKLDTDNYRLLIPSHLANDKNAKYYPEFTGGPSEYLLVNKNEISTTGADCNMIGASFEAFARQRDRCSQQKGSCFNHQPVDLWREDLEARIRGKRGKYFIENFGNVCNTSIKSYSNVTGDYLAMDYFGEYTSILEIEMRADGNAIVRIGQNAQIPSVYIDNITRKKTKIVLSVMNMGLASALFRPRLGECPSNLDPTWCPLEGPLVLIPPQQRHDFKLELTGELPASKVHCAVEVLNQHNKKVARRRITIKKADRCICAFYCKCHCLAGNTKSTCVELSKEEYNAAGIFDPIPPRVIPSGKGSEVFLENLKVVLVTMLYTLLILGIIKGILGLFWRRLGTAGIPVIVGPRVLCQYYEYDISCYEVVYDECGFPVHPQTCKTVQVVPRWLEMFLNFFFFYLYFLRIIWILITSIPCCKVYCDDCEGCCRMEDYEECPPPPQIMPSKTKIKIKQDYYAYNAMTFPSKKNKPQDCLLFNPYKTDEDPLEEDDTEFVLEEIKRYKNKNSND